MWMFLLLCLAATPPCQWFGSATILGQSRGLLKESGEQPVVVGFLHMHKAAGHSVCHLARAQPQVHINGIQSQRTCNMLGDGPSTTSEDSLGKPCDVRWKELAQDKVTFFAIERWMDPLCTGISYMTIVRDPFARLVSHATFESVREHMPIKSNISEAIKVHAGAFQRYQTPKKHYCMWSAQTINNYYTRVLNDKHVYMLPARKVTVDHLGKAKERLSEFDVVIISEEWEKGLQLLAKAFGWTRSLPVQHTGGVLNPTKHTTYEEFFSSHDRELLAELNALDVELYHDVAIPLFQQQLERHHIQ